MTKIINCTCKHKFQDKRYGAGRRVANYKADGNSVVCTICETKHS